MASPPVFQEHLGFLWTTLVEKEEWILCRVGSLTLEKAGLIPNEGGIRLRDAIDAFLRFSDKEMISSNPSSTVAGGGEKLGPWQSRTYENRILFSPKM